MEALGIESDVKVGKVEPFRVGGLSILALVGTPCTITRGFLAGVRCLRERTTSTPLLKVDRANINIVIQKNDVAKASGCTARCLSVRCAV